MIAPHATPAAAYAALGEFLTEDAPELMRASIDLQYENRPSAASIKTYTATIHISQSAFPVWLDLHNIDAGDATLGDFTKTNDVLSVTSPSGVEIFCLIGKTDGGAE